MRVGAALSEIQRRGVGEHTHSLVGVLDRERVVDVGLQVVLIGPARAVGPTRMIEHEVTQRGRVLVPLEAGRANLEQALRGHALCRVLDPSVGNDHAERTRSIDAGQHQIEDVCLGGRVDRQRKAKYLDEVRQLFGRRCCVTHSGECLVEIVMVPAHPAT